MRVYCLVATISLLGGAVSQYINTGGPGANMVLEPLDMLHYPFSYNIPMLTDNIASDDRLFADLDMDLYQRGDMTISATQPKIQSSLSKNLDKRHWLPTTADVDKTIYSRSNNIVSNPTKEQRIVQENGKKPNTIPLESKSTSLMSDILENKGAENMWAWRRASRIREPRLPKIPAGLGLTNKRRNQLVYKPTLKETATKFIKDSKHYNGLRLQHIPLAGRKYPLRIFFLGKILDHALEERSSAFNSLAELIPFKFTRGQKYIAVDLKKDAKRKLKFSSWPGKKFPPIIGPIWTPSKPAIKDRNLNTVIFIRNS